MLAQINARPVNGTAKVPEIRVDVARRIRPVLKRITMLHASAAGPRRSPFSFLGNIQYAVPITN